MHQWTMDSTSYLCCIPYTYRHVLHINYHKYHLLDLSSILILTSIYTIHMQKKPPILHWETAPQQLGLVFDPTLEAHPIGGKSLSPPKVPKEKGDDIRTWGGCCYFVTYLSWFQWCGWYVEKSPGYIVCFAWKFLTLLFQWWGKKRFLVSTEFSRLMRPAGNRQVPSFTAGPCFFFLCF